MKRVFSQHTNRRLVIINYTALLLMNVCFYLVTEYSIDHHVFDVIGLGSIIITIITFVPVHIRTGFWKQVHSDAESLDERQLQVTHQSVAQSYAWFTVICLIIILADALMARFTSGFRFIITVPLGGSLIYLAHSLPSSILAWTETIESIPDSPETSV
ncbi:MAG TPA: hypothetical protein PLV45_07215 [bacterium]|nr:hypothetical protein [bacterium]